MVHPGASPPPSSAARVDLFPARWAFCRLYSWAPLTLKELPKWGVMLWACDLGTPESGRLTFKAEAPRTAKECLEDIVGIKIWSRARKQGRDKKLEKLDLSEEELMTTLRMGPQSFPRFIPYLLPKTSLTGWAYLPHPPCLHSLLLPPPSFPAGPEGKLSLPQPTLPDLLLSNWDAIFT